MANDEPMRPLVFVLIFAPSLAVAQSTLSDGLGPREISVGESGRADARGSQGFTLNPAGISLSQDFVGEGSYGYRPEDQANIANVSLCDSTSPLGGCYYYRYLTASPEIGAMRNSRRAHEGGIALATALTPKIHLGLTAKYYDYETDQTGLENSSNFAADAGVTFQVHNIVQLGAVGYNLIGNDANQYPRAFGTGVALRPLDVLTITGDAVWKFDDNMDKAGRFGGGAEYFFRSDNLTAFPLRGGVVHDSALDTTYITGGLGYTTPKIAIDVGFRNQVSGGDEFMVVAGVRVFGPRQTQGSLTSRSPTLSNE